MAKWHNKAVHRKWRKLVMQRDNWLCQECLKKGKSVLATDAHHIIPVQKRPDLALDIDNGQALCWDCHQKCHAIRDKKIKPLPAGVRIIQI